MRKEPVFAGLIALALLTGACDRSGVGSSAGLGDPGARSTCDAATATDESGLAVATVAMADRAFLPGCFIARSHGQTLRIKNADRTAHTFTVDGTGVDIELPAGTDAKVTGHLADVGLSPGTYPFHCRIHPSMTGVLIVR